MKIEEIQEKKKENDFKMLYIIIAGILILWLIAAYTIPLVYKDMESSGQFGDMFGSLNTMFSGFAFAGIIATILLQRKELVLQRKELEYTREELKLTREEFKKQSGIYKLQAFENTFFNMLDLLNKLRIDEKIIKNVIATINSTGSNYLEDLNKENALNRIEKYFRTFNGINFKSTFSNYFNFFTNIFIVAINPDVKNKSFYLTLLLNQFTDNERMILLYFFVAYNEKYPELIRLSRTHGVFREMDFSDEPTNIVFEIYSSI